MILPEKRTKKVIYQRNAQKKVYIGIYYKNTQQMIILQKSIPNDFTAKMHYKWFYQRNAQQMIFLQICTTNDFVTKMHYK